MLWNPVSKLFPYSILYYTDSFEDKGKALRASLAKLDKRPDFTATGGKRFLGSQILVRRLYDALMGPSG